MVVGPFWPFSSVKTLLELKNVGTGVICQRPSKIGFARALICVPGQLRDQDFVSPSVFGPARNFRTGRSIHCRRGKRLRLDLTESNDIAGSPSVT